MTESHELALPCLDRIRDVVRKVWPEHEAFMAKSLPADDHLGLLHAEQVAGLILPLMGEDIEKFIADYRWTCERLLEEELHFQRYGDYRIKNFAEARREVYDNAQFMDRYVNGLLLSHLFWANHRAVLKYYCDNFLPANPAGFRHLEVGPGHGLFLHLASSHPNCTSALGWDISATSVDHTRQCLKRLGAPESAEVRVQDILGDLNGNTVFESIVISEVLEHLENPKTALTRLKSMMAPNGRIFINVPVNSPAPDHIYLLRTPEQAMKLIEDCGLSIIEQALFPATGYSEKRARKLQATISCGITAARAR
jgi:2-polyprenyl-3-methyl-5-hydroxy-6-metoxy-1,4-benzoquinol methylase